ncbi:zf-HC2 domain-containing protein [Candidatus Bipolaricaulota bacterium]|nr:zf-HC2 domain-containing protein [Candidatus Bipolaricaulota bacterium]
MINCDKARELIPWYVNGTLTGDEAREIASHLAGCPTCREELAQAVRLSWELRAAFDRIPTVPERVWEKVRTHAQGISLARIDVGSFLLGLSLGLSVTRSGIPKFKSDLRLLGRRVALFNSSKGGLK